MLYVGTSYLGGNPGLIGVYETENLRVRGREAAMEVCCGSALGCLEAWRKWPVHS